MTIITIIITYCGLKELVFIDGLFEPPDLRQTGANREEKSLGHVAMVAKSLHLNKSWSCKYVNKKKKLTCMTFLWLIAITNKMLAHIFLPLRSKKQTAASVETVEFQNRCYHGNMKSLVSSLLETEKVWYHFRLTKSSK